MAQDKQKQQSNSQSVSGESPSGEEGSKQSQSQDSSNTPSPDSGSQTPFEFQHPALKGKSPQEIEQLVATADATIREQARTLDQMYEQQQKPQQQQQMQQQGQGQPSKDDFWDDPVGTMDRLISKRLETTIEPFRRDLSRSVWQEAAQSLPNFSRYEQLVRTLARQNGLSEPTLPQINTLYYTAVGLVQSGQVQLEGGIQNQGGGINQDQNNNQPRRAAPPQHDASSHPMSSQPQGGGNKRPLTETERRFMRERGMTEEQYRSLQDAEADEVLTMEVPNG